MPQPSGFIPPCLPSKADQPPSGPDWIHEIKLDGYLLMVRRARTWLKSKNPDSEAVRREREEHWR